MEGRGKWSFIITYHSYHTMFVFITYSNSCIGRNRIEFLFVRLCVSAFMGADQTEKKED